MGPIKKSSCGSKFGPSDGGRLSDSSQASPEASQTIHGEAAEAGTIRLGQPERIAVYARVSTQLQEKEETVKSQLSEITEHLKHVACTILPDNVFVDEGYSGGTLTRPALDQLRDGVAEGRYDSVFVHDPDRLARSYVYQMLLLEEFDKCGCQLQFVRRPIGKSPDEQLLLQMQGVISEYERAKIKERTRRGKMHRMRAGEIVNGRRTFGYCYASKSGDIPAHYQIIPSQAEVVRNIFTWYTQERVSLRELAKRLNDAGIPTARGAKWHGSNMSAILNNSMYTGTGYANKVKATYPRDKPFETVYRKYPKTGKTPRPKEEWVPFSCPAIIDEEIFEIAQQRLAENKRLASRRTKKEYLLRGLISCAHCDKNMMGDTQSKRYICPYTRKQYADEFGMEQCSNTAKHPVDELDEAVWQECVKLVTKPSALKKRHKVLKGKVTPKAAGGYSGLTAQKEKLSQQRKRATDLYIEGMLAGEDFREKVRVVNDKIHVIDRQLEKLKEDRVEEEDLQQMLQSFAKFSQTIRNEAKDADFETKRAIIEQLIKRVIISENDVTIEYAAPLKRNNLCTVSREW
jgi:site-specific DNA recombinase